MDPPVVERHLGTGEEVPDRARHEDLTGPGLRHDAGPDVNGQPAHLRPHRLDLAHVHAGARLDPEAADTVRDGLRAPDGLGGLVERGEEPVARGVDLSTPVALQLPADQDVTAAQCAGVQGNLLKMTGYMVHAWVVPSWESPLGVFSHDNPDVRCADGTFHTDKAGFCAGT